VSPIAPEVKNLPQNFEATGMYGVPAIDAITMVVPPGI